MNTNRYLQLLQQSPFSLVVSLPSNNIELAKAALGAGADAIKVHANVWHRASGHTFGTFSEQRKFLEQIISLDSRCPVGLVPGAQDAFISESEFKELQDMRLGFFSSYVDYLPAFMLKKTSIARMTAIHDNYTQADLNGIAGWDFVDVVEASVISGDAYGTPLNTTDLLRYRNIVISTRKPVLVPTQRAIKPSEVWALKAAGCKAVMIGAIVMGKEADAHAVEKATTEFRQVIDTL